MRDPDGNGPILARPAWSGWYGQPPKPHHHPGGWGKDEWLPRPVGGGVKVKLNGGDTGGEATVYLQVVPGPEGRWQLVRVELGTPVARGFVTKEGARAWVARAIRAGVLPKGVVVVEPNAGEG